MLRTILRGFPAIAVAALCGARLAAAEPMVTQQPDPAPEIARYVVGEAHEPRLSREAEIKLLQRKVKYVFVLFQENRSFDSYFATFPGAHGLFSQPPDQTPGFIQPIMNVDGTMGTVSPFRIGPDQYAADTDDIDHSYARMAAKMDVKDGKAMMDQFAMVEEKKYTVPPATTPSLKAKQFGELAMAYEDCDTVPFLWQYASRFTLFDTMFQHTIGPSSPGAISLIAAQTGETQMVKHPDTDAASLPANAKNGVGEPVTTDARPFWGSPQDTASHDAIPRNPNDKPYPPQLNQTYATLPLSLGGKDAGKLTQSDASPATDLADVRKDVAALVKRKTAAMPWGWFQEGFGHEPTDPAGAAAGGTHTSYVTHHNGPAFFGYVSNNPQMSTNLHALSDFFAMVKDGKLAKRGGLYYVRGGYTNIAGLVPADPDPIVRKQFLGDDDHPAYSDSQISEALVAAEVNAIARSPYWKDSAIIITYDESEGDYDHVPPTIIETGPDKGAIARGPRIPLILISPYARTHVVSHEPSEQSSVIRFVDILFNLPPLADLPDELAARVEGKKKYGQDNLGPADDRTPGVSGLLSAFDPARLASKLPPLPASYAEIDDQVVATIPPYDNKGCKAIGMVPTDIARGIPNPIPADFNPRPATNPSP